MERNESFKNLRVWEEGMALAAEVYKLASTGRLSRDFGLKDQMCRAAVSIPSNIVEGYDRSTNKELLYYLNVAHGSLAELRTQVELAHRIEYIDEDVFGDIDDRCKKLGAMLLKFRRARTGTSRDR